MFKKCSFILFVLIVCFSITAGCADHGRETYKIDPLKEKIIIGQVVSLTGQLAFGVSVSSGPVYDMWVEDVNNQGGIFVKEYGKKLPIEYIKYDDKSDADTMEKLLSKLILEDKVDFLLPPWGTTFLYTAAAIANKHEYILIGGAGGAIELKEAVADMKYFFSTLNHADTQMPVLVDILEELAIKSVTISFVQDLHGVEYAGTLVPELLARGIDVKIVKGHPEGTQDFVPLLNQAKGYNSEAFLAFVYPGDAMNIVTQSIENNFNFDVFLLSVCPIFGFFRDVLGAEAVEGIMGTGAWNTKSLFCAGDFYEKYVRYFGEEPDFWGSLVYYASLEHLQQAIEEAGTLDQRAIRDILATRIYDTCIGPFSYDNGTFIGHLGQIGQWQNGIFEVIDPGSNRTAAPKIKPKWM
ncbi:MAG: amino acid ABC transporter substrate-binding protein [Bacillota bacterium]|nr:amino acid ABC transporter substrate-binding protein [Bacillota bacterium]